MQIPRCFQHDGGSLGPVCWCVQKKAHESEKMRREAGESVACRIALGSARSGPCGAPDKPRPVAAFGSGVTVKSHATSAPLPPPGMSGAFPPGPK